MEADCEEDGRRGLDPSPREAEATEDEDRKTADGPHSQPGARPPQTDASIRRLRSFAKLQAGKDKDAAGVLVYRRTDRPLARARPLSPLGPPTTSLRCPCSRDGRLGPSHLRSSVSKVGPNHPPGIDLGTREGDKNPPRGLHLQGHGSDRETRSPPVEPSGLHQLQDRPKVQPIHCPPLVQD